MASSFPTYSGYVDYPISKLSPLNFNENAWMELVVDDYGNGDYVNRKTKIITFYDFIISSHPIFNKIDDVYNDQTYVDVNEDTNTTSYRYGSDIFISGQTYFAKNPFAYDTSPYPRLSDNQTVQKRQLEKYVHDNSLEINTIKTEDTCVQYGEYGWYKSTSDSDNPRIDALSFVKFKETSKDFEIQNNKSSSIPLNHSKNAINVYSNSFVTIVGKIKMHSSINKDLAQTPYYSVENNIWVGIWSNGNLIAISELHNYDGNIAYYSFQLPLTRDTDYYIVVPFDVDTSASNSSTNSSSYDMFENIAPNTAAIFYYSESMTKEGAERPYTLFN
jgi:hypothetical protein